jgi:hypothetical protein
MGMHRHAPAAPEQLQCTLFRRFIGSADPKNRPAACELGTGIVRMMACNGMNQHHAQARADGAAHNGGPDRSSQDAPGRRYGPRSGKAANAQQQGDCKCLPLSDTKAACRAAGSSSIISAER